MILKTFPLFFIILLSAVNASFGICADILKEYNYISSVSRNRTLFSKAGGQARMNYLYQIIQSPSFLSLSLNIRDEPKEKQLLRLVNQVRNRQGFFNLQSSIQSSRVLIKLKIMSANAANLKQWQMIEKAVYLQIVKNLDYKLALEQPSEYCADFLAPEVNFFLDRLGVNFTNSGQIFMHLNSQKTINAVYLKCLVSFNIRFINEISVYTDTNLVCECGRYLNIVDFIELKFKQTQNIKEIYPQIIDPHMDMVMSCFLQLLIWLTFEELQLPVEEYARLLKLANDVRLYYSANIERFFPNMWLPSNFE